MTLAFLYSKGLELLVYVAFLIVVTCASFIYYKTIEKAQLEYEASRDILKNITLDFSYRLQKISREVNKLLIDFEEFKRTNYSMKEVGEENKKIIFDILEKYKALSSKVFQIECEINKLKDDYAKGEKRDLLTANNTNLDNYIEDDVLKNLTETEVEVLCIIEEKGEASVSEIRNRISKTREHTARLLKKLYDRGYIDRNSNRMPYRYYVRKELKNKIKNRQKVNASI